MTESKQGLVREPPLSLLFRSVISNLFVGTSHTQTSQITPRPSYCFFSIPTGIKGKNKNEKYHEQKYISQMSFVIFLNGYLKEKRFKYKVNKKNSLEKKTS